MNTVETMTAPERVRLRELCPKGFVPKSGFGQCRTCKTCDRQLDQHAPVVQ